MTIQKIYDWVLIHSIGTLLFLSFYLLLDWPVYFIIGFSVISIGYFIVQNSLTKGKASMLNLANIITLTRFMLLPLLAYLIFYGFSFLSTFLALSLFILDGLDGYMARLQGTESVFGHYFDMESDALFVLILTLGLMPLFKFIWLVGALRYIYFVFYFPFRNNNFPEKKYWWAKYIAGIFMFFGSVSLTIQNFWSIRLLAVATLLILCSFALGFFTLIKNVYANRRDK